MCAAALSDWWIQPWAGPELPRRPVTTRLRRPSFHSILKGAPPAAAQWSSYKVAWPPFKSPAIRPGPEVTRGAVTTRLQCFSVPSDPSLPSTTRVSNHRPMRIHCRSGPSRRDSRAQNAGCKGGIKTPSAHLSTQLCRRGAGAGTGGCPPERVRGEFSQFTRDSAAGQGAGWGGPEMGSGKVVRHAPPPPRRYSKHYRVWNSKHCRVWNSTPAQWPCLDWGVHCAVR